MEVKSKVRDLSAASVLMFRGVYLCPLPDDLRVLGVYACVRC